MNSKFDSYDRNTKDERQTGIELLRIILMFFIVTTHLLSRSFNLPFNNKLPNIVNYLFVYSRFGNMASDIFFIIFGYYNYKKKISIKKVFKLELQAIFYLLTIYLLFVFFGIEIFDFKRLLLCFFPTLTGQWWFLTAYILVYLFSPIINKLFDKMKNPMDILYIDIFCILFCFVLIVLNVDSTLITVAGCFEMYVLGYILKKMKYMPNIRKCISIVLLLIIILYIPVTVYSFFNIEIVNLIPKLFDKILLCRLSPLSVLFSIYLFLLFANIKWNNSIINRLAKGSFAIYLIHENSMTRYRIIELFQLSRIQNTLYMPIILIVDAIIIMCVCILLDEIRRLIFKSIGNLYKRVFIS